MKRIQRVFRFKDKTIRVDQELANRPQISQTDNNGTHEQSDSQIINKPSESSEKNCPRSRNEKSFPFLSPKMKPKASVDQNEAKQKDKEKKKKHKTKMSVTIFQKEFYSLLVENIYKNPTWSGNLEIPGFKELLISAQKANISTEEICIYKWLTYVNVFKNCDPKCYQAILALLLETLDPITKILDQNSTSQNNLQVDEIWKSFELLVVKLTDIVTGQCNEIVEGISIQLTTKPILRLLGSLSEIYGTLQHPGSVSLTNLPLVMRKLKTMFSATAEKMYRLTVKPFDVQGILDGILELVELLKRNRDYWKTVFTSNKIKLDLYELIYSVWDYKIHGKVKTILQESLHVCQPIQFKDEFPVISSNLDLSHELLLFELYKALNAFSSLTDSPGLPHLVHIKGSFHEMFRPFVTQWVDIMCYKGMMQIEHAVQLDYLEPITVDSKISSSAVETIAILETMKISWKELEWPDQEEAYSFALLALKNFDHCITYYVGSIYNRVEVLENEKFENYEISDEICIALNNVGFIKEQVHSIVAKFSVTDIIRKLSTERSPNSTAIEVREDLIILQLSKELLEVQYFVVTQQCTDTLPNLVECWTENVNRQMLKNLSTSCSRIEPLIHLYMESGFYDESMNSTDQFAIHLNGILEQMNAKLTITEFKQAFPIVWEKIFESFLSFTEKKLKCQQNHYSINKLDEMFIKLLQLFFGKELDELQDHSQYNEFIILKRKIELHKLSTHELILQHFDEMYNYSKSQDTETIGKISIISHYCEVSETLNLKILNAALPNSGDINPYIKFQVHERFNPQEIKHSTKVKKKTDHPIFEEKFLIKFPLQDFTSGGYIQFWIKQEVGSWGKFIGEAYLPLTAVPLTNTRVNIDDLIQIKLPIIRPTSEITDILNILKIRKTFDKEAFKFLSILRSRWNMNMS